MVQLLVAQMVRDRIDGGDHATSVLLALTGVLQLKATGAVPVPQDTPMKSLELQKNPTVQVRVFA